jgi:hypothetical protein
VAGGGVSLSVAGGAATSTGGAPLAVVQNKIEPRTAAIRTERRKEIEIALDEGPLR